MLKTSRKTSLSALVAALGLALSQAPPDAIPHWLRVAGLILCVAGTALAGLFARDNDVSSEEARGESDALKKRLAEINEVGVRVNVDDFRRRMGMPPAEGNVLIDEFLKLSDSPKDPSGSAEPRS